jgi:hypothetical protein
LTIAILIQFVHVPAVPVVAVLFFHVHVDLVPPLCSMWPFCFCSLLCCHFSIVLFLRLAKVYSVHLQPFHSMVKAIKRTLNAQEEGVAVCGADAYLLLQMKVDSLM